MRAAALLGAVLAGGESRRFGRDKAAEMIAGKTLVERAGETLAEVFEHVVVVSSHEPLTDRWRHVEDRRVGQGPLAGIEAALVQAEALGLEGAFILACDLPLVDATAVRSVLEAGGDAVACAPWRAAHPGIEPLCAVYRVTALPLVAGALDEGRRSVHEVFAAARGVVTEVPGNVFLNVNNPADGALAAMTLEVHEPSRPPAE